MPKTIIAKLRWLDHCETDPTMGGLGAVAVGEVGEDDVYSSGEGVNVIYDYATKRAYTVVCVGCNSLRDVGENLEQYTRSEL